VPRNPIQVQCDFMQARASSSGFAFPYLTFQHTCGFAFGHTGPVSGT